MLLLLKLAYLGLLSCLLWLWNDFDFDRFYTAMARWPRDGHPVFASRFATWDSAHYLYLSEVGYHQGEPSCAFYPLWPLLVRWCSPLFGGNDVLAGTILANVLSLVAWVLFYRLVARRCGRTAANWSLAFLIAFPGALFFQFNYTESLFLLLTLVLWWGLIEQRFWWSWMAAALLPTTRGIGVFAVLPIAWHALIAARPALRLRLPWLHADTGAILIQNDSLRKSGEQWRLYFKAVAGGLWLLCAPLLGWSLYLWMMWSWTGNPFEGVQAQKYWGVHSINNLWNVPKFVFGLFTPTSWHDFQGSLLDRSVFMLVLYCLPVLWRLDKELLVWIYVLGVLPAMSGTFTSFTRFACCAFPVFISLGIVLGKPQRCWPRYGLLATFLVFHAVLLWRFVNFRWAG